MADFNGKPINDGSGLWDNEGICDKAILLCNDAIKNLVGGEYINFCNEIYQVARILQNLKKGIRNDRESLEHKIEELKRMNDSMCEQLTGLPVIHDEKDGVKDGGC